MSHKGSQVKIKKQHRLFIEAVFVRNAFRAAGSGARVREDCRNGHRGAPPGGASRGRAAIEDESGFARRRRRADTPIEKVMRPVIIEPPLQGIILRSARSRRASMAPAASAAGRDIP